jgi:putative sigma-54 modulation protein
VEKTNAIVKRKYFEMKPMHEEEAILQMNMLGHNSFMFYNASMDKMCMIYRRKDEQFGLIISELL